MRSVQESKFEPIVKEIEIGAPSAVVFELFVTRFGDWWPRSRFSRTRGEAPTEVVLEPWLGGEIYEVGNNGNKLLWGSVTKIEPDRLIEMDWHLGRPTSTTVEVTFKPLPLDRTQLRLVHRGWERLEAVGAAVERQGYEGGWDIILQQAFLPFTN
jgi:uncharacterized protein YndB with AHSA1/START domain